MTPEECRIHQDQITEMGEDNDTATGVLLAVVMGLIGWAFVYSLLR